MTQWMLLLYMMAPLAIIVGVFLVVKGIKTLYHAIWDACAYLKERKELKWM